MALALVSLSARQMAWPQIERPGVHWLEKRNFYPSGCTPMVNFRITIDGGRHNIIFVIFTKYAAGNYKNERAAGVSCRSCLSFLSLSQG
jgi:hypothetical protein